MSVFYYDQPINRRSWKSTLPTLILFSALALIYLISLILSTKIPSISVRPLLSASSFKSNAAVFVNSDDITIDKLMQATNEARISSGVPPLKQDILLDKSAELKCLDLVKNNYWSHQDKLGREPWHYIGLAGYNKMYAGENLAYGFINSQLIIEGWKNSKDHRATLLDRNFEDIGFAICKSDNFLKQGKQTIIVQHLGKQLPKVNK